jgi:hypothetical protein
MSGRSLKWLIGVLAVLGLAAGLYSDLEGLLGGMRLVRPSITAAASIYLLSHLLRMLRMLVILGHSAQTIRGVILALALAAPVTALIPLKIGEFFRIYLLGGACGGFFHAFRAVWLERSFDAAALATVGGLALWLEPNTPAQVLTVSTMGMAFLGLTFFGIFLIPQNLGFTKDYFIIRYNQEWTVRLLRRIEALRLGLVATRKLIQGKVGVVLLSTILIWTLEVLALWMFLRAMPLDIIIPGVLAVLSDIFQPMALAVPELREHMVVHRFMVIMSVSGLALAGLVFKQTRYGRSRREALPHR